LKLANLILILLTRSQKKIKKKPNERWGYFPLTQTRSAEVEGSGPKLLPRSGYVINNKNKKGMYANNA
jgi:hypothetical protein